VAKAKDAAAKDGEPFDAAACRRTCRTELDRELQRVRELDAARAAKTAKKAEADAEKKRKRSDATLPKRSKRPKVREPIAAPKKRTMHLPKKMFDGDAKKALAGWRDAPIDAAAAALPVLKKTQDGERTDLTCRRYLKLDAAGTEETFLAGPGLGSVDGEDDRVTPRFNAFKNKTTLFFLDENGFGVLRRTSRYKSQPAVCYSLVQRVEAAGGTEGDFVELVGELSLVYAAAIGTKKRKSSSQTRPTHLTLHSGAAARDLDTGKVCRVFEKVWGGGAWKVQFPGDDELVERPADKLEAIEAPPNLPPLP
jgi:hypothetical protein